LKTLHQVEKLFGVAGEDQGRIEKKSEEHDLRCGKTFPFGLNLNDA